MCRLNFHMWSLVHCSDVKCICYWIEIRDLEMVAWPPPRPLLHSYSNWIHSLFLGYYIIISSSEALQRMLSIHGQVQPLLIRNKPVLIILCGFLPFETDRNLFVSQCFLIAEMPERKVVKMRLTMSQSSTRGHKSNKWYLCKSPGSPW